MAELEIGIVSKICTAVVTLSLLSGIIRLTRLVILGKGQNFVKYILSNKEDYSINKST
jgi:hypothetical protein